MPHRRRRVRTRHPRSAAPLNLGYGNAPAAITLTVSSDSALISSSRPAFKHSQPTFQSHKRWQRWQSLMWESALGIVVNVLITGAALNGVVRLLPLQLTQHNRLQLLKQDVSQLNRRVSQLRSQFDRTMDPLQTQALIRERENQVPPNHIQLQFVPPQTVTGMHPGEGVTP
jgi:hypothetical protein